MLTAMSACMLLSVRMPVMPLALAGFVIIPVYMVSRMRRIADQYVPYDRFTPLWLYGMYSLIFGTLICTLLSSLYVLWFEPDFINLYIDQTMATLAQGLDGDLKQLHEENLRTIALARERHLLPSPLEFISSLGWSTAFFGSLATIPLALIAVRRGQRARLRRLL